MVLYQESGLKMLFGFLMASKLKIALKIHTLFKIKILMD